MKSILHPTVLAGIFMVAAYLPGEAVSGSPRPAPIEWFYNSTWEFRADGIGRFAHSEKWTYWLELDGRGYYSEWEAQKAGEGTAPLLLTEGTWTYADNVLTLTKSPKCRSMEVFDRDHQRMFGVEKYKILPRSGRNDLKCFYTLPNFKFDGVTVNLKRIARKPERENDRD